MVILLIFILFALCGKLNGSIVADDAALNFSTWNALDHTNEVVADDHFSAKNNSRVRANLLACVNNERSLLNAVKGASTTRYSTITLCSPKIKISKTTGIDLSNKSIVLQCTYTNNRCILDGGSSKNRIFYGRMLRLKTKRIDFQNSGGLNRTTNMGVLNFYNSSVSIVESSFQGNKGGSLLYLKKTSVVLRNVSFQNNTANETLYIVGRNVSATITNSLFRQNLGTQILMYDNTISADGSIPLSSTLLSKLFIGNSLFYNNTSSIKLASVLGAIGVKTTIKSVNITRNTNAFGGSLAFLKSQVSLTDCRFSENTDAVKFNGETTPIAASMAIFYDPKASLTCSNVKFCDGAPPILGDYLQYVPTCTNTTTQQCLNDGLAVPTLTPTISSVPSLSPSIALSMIPSISSMPSESPAPSIAPSISNVPSLRPSLVPTATPTVSSIPSTITSEPTYILNVDNVCFSGYNTIEVKDVGIIRMDQLKIGDYVKVGNNDNYSLVYSFAHYSPDTDTEFLQIHFHDQGNDGTHSPPLEVTSMHLMFVSYRGNKPMAIPASDVKVGDSLVGNKEVIAIDRITRRGMYAPLTDSGDIMVSDILSSNFVQVIQSKWFLWNQHDIGRIVFIPYRFYCQHYQIDGTCIDESYTSQGFSWYTNVIINICIMVDKIGFLAAVLLSLLFAPGFLWNMSTAESTAYPLGFVLIGMIAYVFIRKAYIRY